MSRMLSQIHFQKHFLGLLNRESFDVVSHINDQYKKKRTCICYPSFLPVEIEPDDLDQSIVHARIDSRYTTVHEIVNTLAYLEGTVLHKCRLTIERPNERPKWNVCENNGKICITLPKDDLQIIQSGWGCRVAAHRKTRMHFRKPVYDWIGSLWHTPNKSIFKHIYMSLLDIVGHNSDVVYRFSDNHVALVKRLTTLLHKFGNDKMVFLWEKSFFKDYTETKHPFLSSLMAFLVPWDINDNRTYVRISEDGVKLLSGLCSMCGPYEIGVFLRERQTHKCKDGRYAFRCSINMYEPFYSYLLSDSVTPTQALKLFLSVQYPQRGVKTIGKKRSIYETRKTRMRGKNLFSKFENIYGKDSIYTVQVTQEYNGACHLAKLILLCEMRKIYMDYKWEGTGYTPEQYWTLACAENFWEFVKHKLQNDTAVKLFVSLARQDVTVDNVTNTAVKESFPVLRFVDSVKADVEKIKIDKYFR